MARVLIVVPPLTGHTNPTLGFGAELMRRGHQVAWCGYESKLRRLPEGATAFFISEQDDSGRAERVLQESSQLRGLRSVKFFFEEFMVPLARSMVPVVRDAAGWFEADVMVVDQQALAGSIVARERGIPWVTSCTTSAGVVEPLDAFPKIVAWQDGLLRSLQEEFSVPVMRRPGLSPHGVVVFSTKALAGMELPEHYHFVGPVVSPRPEVVFPWDQLRAGRKVLVSLGTVSFARGERFYQAVVDGLGGLDLQVILVAPTSLVPVVPDNFLRWDYVPQLDLLPHVDAVVSHGGHNTVVESLAAGKPLVVAPIRDDQPVVAGQVVAAGAGVRLKFGRARGDRIRAAVLSVLEDPSYRLAAERIQAGFAEAGGAGRAAEVVEALLTH